MGLAERVEELERLVAELQRQIDLINAAWPQIAEAANGTGSG